MNKLTYARLDSKVLKTLAPEQKRALQVSLKRNFIFVMNEKLRTVEVSEWDYHVHKRSRGFVHVPGATLADTQGFKKPKPEAKPAVALAPKTPKPAPGKPKIIPKK